MTLARKRWITVLVLLATVFAVGAGVFPLARHWASYNGFRVIGQRNESGQFVVNGTTNRSDFHQIVMVLCLSPSYTKREYEKSRDINVYGAYLFAKGGPISTSDLQQEVDKGANVEHALIRWPH